MISKHFFSWKHHLSFFGNQKLLKSFYQRKSPVSQGVWNALFSSTHPCPSFFGIMYSLSGSITQDAVTTNKGLTCSLIDGHFSHSRFFATVSRMTVNNLLELKLAKVCFFACRHKMLSDPCENTENLQLVSIIICRYSSLVFTRHTLLWKYRI